MANCYLCGRYIAPIGFHLRRRVKVGECVRRKYPTSLPNAVHARYGFRIVCTRCAYAIDRRQRIQVILDAAMVLVPLILLVLFLASSK